MSTDKQLVPNRPRSILDDPTPAPHAQVHAGQKKIYSDSTQVRFGGTDGDQEVEDLAKFGFGCGLLHPKYDPRG